MDGNEYVDFNNALCAITLGHCDADVSKAVERELRRGTIFSLSSEIEIEVARLIVATVPCAEKVRFGKNGSDATAGAIRAARAFTGRERVAVCGYHGWQGYPYTSPFRAGAAVTLTSSCHATSTWLASATNTPPPAAAGERGR